MKKELGIFILLVVLCVFIALMPGSNFLQLYNIQNLARLVGMYGILGIGLGLVIITGGIDLSVGSVFALQGVVLSILLAERSWPWPLALGLTMLGAIGLGAFHGFLVTRIRMQPFILTLCGLLVYRSVARYIADDQSKGFGDATYGHLRFLTTGTWLGVPMPFITMTIVAIAAWVLLHRSVYGRYLFAVGRNEEAAKYSGINSKLIISSAYMLCTLLAVLSGTLFAIDTNSIQATDFGNSYELYGIAAAVLGGCSLRGGEGSIVGIVIGTALLQVLQNMVTLLGIPSSLNSAVMGVIIFFGVLVDLLVAKRGARTIRDKASVPASARHA